MSLAVQLVSDFVSTPYVLRQLHGIKVIPPPVTCVMLMRCSSKMSSMSFSTAPIPTWLISLRWEYAPLFPSTGAYDVFTFLSQNNSKLYFFLNELWGQSHFLAEGFFCLVKLENSAGSSSFCWFSFYCLLCSKCLLYCLLESGGVGPRIPVKMVGAIFKLLRHANSVTRTQIAAVTQEKGLKATKRLLQICQSHLCYKSRDAKKRTAVPAKAAVR
jgi:hypothetical protein